MPHLKDIDPVAEPSPGLIDEIRSLSSIRDILSWMQHRGIRLDSLDVITQDEFSHDVLVPVGPTGDWAAFGVT